MCQFEDVYEVERVLHRTGAFETHQAKNYIKSPKPNGYRSLHLILRFSAKTLDGKQAMPVEIQVRTIAMDFWASLEHELKYKKEVPNTKLIFSELKRCADEIASVDLSMQTLYE